MLSIPTYMFIGSFIFIKKIIVLRIGQVKLLMKKALMTLSILAVVALIKPLPAWADFTEFGMVNNVLEPGTMLFLGSCLLGLGLFAIKFRK